MPGEDFETVLSWSSVAAGSASAGIYGEEVVGTQSGGERMRSSWRIGRESARNAPGARKRGGGDFEGTKNRAAWSGGDSAARGISNKDTNVGLRGNISTDCITSALKSLLG